MPKGGGNLAFWQPFWLANTEISLQARPMTNTPNNDDKIGPQIAMVRATMPAWVIATSELVERAKNAERAATHVNPEVADRSRKLIIEIAEWQQKLGEWQAQPVSARLGAEMRILKATLDASMDEANSAASALHLFD
jgi:hypothetical protein